VPAEVPVESVDWAAYRIPTDAPEADGTFAWDSTTMVVVHARGGGETGLGWTYGAAAAARLVDDVLAPAVSGRSVLQIGAAHAAMRAALRNVMDLAGTMLAELGPKLRPGGRSALLGRISSYIDDHLADPELGPAAIAAAHYISPRRLHQLFEETGYTVASWIRARRIDNCRRDLADARLSHLPVATIGARWGFRGASHFGQVFKRETGLAPAEFRRQTG